jgi:hypothetical protein
LVGCKTQNIHQTDGVSDPSAKFIAAGLSISEARQVETALRKVAYTHGPIHSVKRVNLKTIEISVGELGMLSGHLDVYTFRIVHSEWNYDETAIYFIEG